jgi:hypothetical protein
MLWCVSAWADLIAAAIMLWPFDGSHRRDQALLRDGKARCAIRAARGRVLDIGEEWSAGTCEISVGRIRFSPTIGIVGDRDIPVLEVLASDVDPDEVRHLGLRQTVTYVIRTERGDLWWALPDPVANPASDLLFGIPEHEIELDRPDIR